MQCDEVVQGSLAGEALASGVDKLGLGWLELPFLGYLLKEEQLHCDPAKTEAIARLIPPETRTQLCAFLGLAGYFRHFISGFAAKAHPLYVLRRTVYGNRKRQKMKPLKR